MLKKPMWILLIIAVLVIVIDQFSKYLVSVYLPLGGAWSPFPGEHPIFQIIHTANSGVAFGLFQGLGPVFIVVALIVAGAIIVYARKLHDDQWFTALALGFMLGGALGNVIDRLTRQGQVIDFLDVGIGTTRWYTSNLADISIVLGVILLGLATLLDERKQKTAKASETTHSGA